MKTSHFFLCLAAVSGLFVFSQCAEKAANDDTTRTVVAQADFGGYDTQEKWGEHLVLIAGCHDCHTPKMMTPHGPDFDMSRMLSGHPSDLPAPEINRNEIEGKGLVVTQTLTSWVGPWGVSYAANLTSDPTGVGNWQENNFITAIRKGKLKGLESSRNLLPPMPWEMYRNMTDEELKAIFSFLKSTKPIKNIVPEPNQPILARK